MNHEQARVKIYKFSFVDKNGCVVWSRSKAGNGYGVIYCDKRQQYTHRVIYEVEKGQISPGLEVMHTCDNPSCVNIEHLKLGTHAENMKDVSIKKRFNNQNMGKPECVRGHKFTEENTYRSKTKKRQCKECIVYFRNKYKELRK